MKVRMQGLEVIFTAIIVSKTDWFIENNSLVYYEVSRWMHLVRCFLDWSKE